MDNIFTKIPEVLGILPDSKFYHKSPSLYKFYSILHVFYNFGMTFYPVIIGINRLKSGYYPENQVFGESMALVKNIVYSIIVSVSVLYQNVLYPQEYYEMKLNFRTIDDIFKLHKTNIENKWIWAKNVLFYLIFISYIFYIYCGDHATYDLHIVYTVLLTWIYYNFLLEIILAWMWLEAVRQRLYFFNRIIADLKVQKEQPEQLFIETIEESRNHWKTICDLIKIQQNIIRNVNIFNLLIGLSVALRSLLFVIEFLTMVIGFIAKVDGLLFIVLDAVVDGLGWCVFILKSQHVIDEGQQSINLCLDTTTSWLVNEKQPESCKARSEKELLAHLTQRVSEQTPYFTAAKFYVINFAAFFMIANITAGYIVIVIQFAQSK